MVNIYYRNNKEFSPACNNATTYITYMKEDNVLLIVHTEEQSMHARQLQSNGQMNGELLTLHCNFYAFYADNCKTLYHCYCSTIQCKKQIYSLVCIAFNWNGGTGIEITQETKHWQGLSQLRNRVNSKSHHTESTVCISSNYFPHFRKTVPVKSFKKKKKAIALPCKFLSHVHKYICTV